MTSKQHDAILRSGAETYGITEKDYRETVEYAALVRDLLRGKRK